MLTPQDIESKELPKAVFGGYDMTAVDEFLEQLAADYAALYKDNMILKGKLKVLVEKVEEYRSTEDAMRMALLTAQKMSDDMMAETKQKCDAMMAAAARDSDESRARAAEDISHEDMKLEAAKVKTAAFVAASRQILEQYETFLSKLDGVTAQFGGTQSPAAPAPAEAPVVSPEPERAEQVPAPAAPVAEQPVYTPPVEAPVYTPAPEGTAAGDPDGESPAPEEDEGPVYTPSETPDFDAAPVYTPSPRPDPAPPQGVDLGGEIDPAPRAADEADLGGATRRIDIEAVRRFYSGDGETKRMAWDEEDEMTTPRPKFDFSDLRFGSNYSEDEQSQARGRKKKDK